MPGASSKARSSRPVPATAARTGWGPRLWGHTSQVAHALWCSEPQGCSGDRVTNLSPIRSHCQGCPGVFWLLVLLGPAFTRWELGTSRAPSASHPAQGSSGVPSEPRWGAGCWNRAQ